MEDCEKQFLELLEGEKETGEETGEKRRMKGAQEEGIGGNTNSIKEEEKETSDKVWWHHRRSMAVQQWAHYRKTQGLTQEDMERKRFSGRKE